MLNLHSNHARENKIAFIVYILAFAIYKKNQLTLTTISYPCTYSYFLQMTNGIEMGKPKIVFLSQWCNYTELQPTVKNTSDDS